MKEIKLTKKQIKAIKPIADLKKSYWEKANVFLDQYKEMSNRLWEELYKMHPELEGKKASLCHKTYTIREIESWKQHIKKFNN